MNIFEKMKLKSMLRNCDYELAGTVIKQQYYDYQRNTELNRLIDDFQADPGFDQALRLIKYSEMMVFYFTESCTGGLYIRQSSPEAQELLADREGASSPNKPDMPTQSAQPARREPARPRSTSAATSASQETPHRPEPASEAQETNRADQAAASPIGSLTQDAVSQDTMSYNTINNRFSFNPSKLEQQEQDPEKIQSLKESYDWMKQMISKKQVKRNLTDDADSSSYAARRSTRDSTAEHEPATNAAGIAEAFRGEPEAAATLQAAETSAHADDSPAEPIAETASQPAEAATEPAGAPIEPAAVPEPKTEAGEPERAHLPQTPAAVRPAADLSSLTVDRDVPEEAHTLEFEAPVAATKQIAGSTPSKPKKPVEVFYETAPYEPVHKWAEKLDESVIAAALDRKPSSDGTAVPSLEQPAAALPKAPPRPSFPNVVATLQIDIDTMRQQVQEFRRHLRINPWDSDEIRANIRTLEEAIDEFTKAIHMLKGEPL